MIDQHVHLAHHAKAVMNTVLSADHMGVNPAKAAIHVHQEKRIVRHANHSIENRAKTATHAHPDLTAIIDQRVQLTKTATALKTAHHALKTAKKGHSVSQEDYPSPGQPISQSVSGLKKAMCHQ